MDGLSKNVLLIISGAAASGKTSLIKAIMKDNDVLEYRPCEAFVELGLEKGYSISDSFFKISPVSAEDLFVSKCKENRMVLANQHMAIQYKKDSKFAESIDIDETDEQYTASMRKELFQKLVQSKITVIIVYLFASPETLFQRAYTRYKEDNHPIRNYSIEDVKKEIDAENTIFTNTSKYPGVRSFKFDTEKNTPEEIALFINKEISFLSHRSGK